MSLFKSIPHKVVSKEELAKLVAINDIIVSGEEPLLDKEKDLELYLKNGVQY